MLPLGVENRFLFRLEQRFRGHGLYSRAVGQTGVTGIIGLQCHRLLIQCRRGVRKYKRVIAGCSYNPVNIKPADCGAVPRKHIFFRTGGYLKARSIRPGCKGFRTVLRAGKDMEIARHVFEGFHYPKDHGSAAEGQERFSGEAA
jgi:hypothetical protein